MSRTRGALLTSVALAATTAVALSAPTAPGNRAAAQSDAHAHLAGLQLPPGTEPSPSEPAGDGGALAHAAVSQATPNLVADHGWWILDASPGQALAFVDAHPPHGSRLTGEGTSAGPSRPTTTTHVFSWPALRGVLATRWLVVTVVGLRSGRTGLRADAEDVWSAVRPARERVPHGVRLVVVTVAQVTGPPSRSRTIASPRLVGALVSLADSLAPAQPGAQACPADIGPRATLLYLASPHTQPLARMVAQTGGCDLVDFWIDGIRQPELSGATRVLRRLHALGVS